MVFNPSISPALDWCVRLATIIDVFINMCTILLKTYYQCILIIQGEGFHTDSSTNLWCILVVVRILLFLIPLDTLHLSFYIANISLLFLSLFAP